ncbi:MAG: hypothetical protein LBR66_03975 [Candidatus Symbiothrix sp.]|jgi:spore germination protein YaaH|nr:hypothetical protein [Candidatus Symbiothrix sp.]
MNTNRCILALVSIIFLLSACRKSDDAAKNTKQLHPWYVYDYHHGRGFADIAPVKDLLASISVFGNPPQSFIDECHQNNIEIYLAVSGNESNIDTSEKIQEITDKYVSDCNTKDYDGIDLDFEQLSPDFQATYTLFLTMAADKLHKAGKKLSHCVGYYPALHQDNQAKIFYDAKALAATCDLVRVMCYDMYYAPGVDNPSLTDRDDCMGIGATSTYPFTKEAMRYWLQRIPSEKLLMALPAYSNDYAVSDNIHGRQIYQSTPDSLKGVLPPPRWLWYEQVNLYHYDGLDGCKHLFYAADARSTEALLSLADELKINKIGFWHLSSIAPEMWEKVAAWKKK